jgi:hypothetical protein
MDAPAIELTIKNFRALRDFVWAPSGLCLLSGANGAGKSSTLDALLFLRAVFERGHEAAFQIIGGQHLKHLDAPDDEPVEFSLRVGELRWVLRFPMGVMGTAGHFGEELHDGDVVRLRAGMFESFWHLGTERQEHDEVRCCARVLWDRETPSWMHPLVEVISALRIYLPFELRPLRRAELVESRDSVLARNGRNLWPVLSNWRASPSRHRGQFDRVVEAARRALPGLFVSMEFDRGLPVFFPSATTDPDRALPAGRMADGLLSALLVLTGLIGAPPGSIVAFDEVESRLHPHAIRSLLATMREEVEARGLTVILTTHSPVVMNEFRDTPEQVFVLEPSPDHPTVPNALSVLHAEAWLAQAKLGTLYDQLAFAAPPVQVE